MRISHQQVYQTIVRNLNGPLERMLKDQIKIATGRRINRPSDDPSGASRAIEVRSQLKAIKHYKGAIWDAMGWFSQAEVALDHSQTLLIRARELAIQGGNDTLTDADREALAQEVNQILEDMASAANTQYNDKYVFSGTATRKAPVVVQRDESGKINNVSFQSNSDSAQREIQEGEYMALGISAQQLFGGDTGPMATLIRLRDALASNRPEDIRGSVDDLDESLERSLEMRALVGAKVNRLQRGDERLDEEKLTLTGALADLEDADVVETAVDMQAQEVAYRAALAVGAKLMGPSLLDYLG